MEICGIDVPDHMVTRAMKSIAYQSKRINMVRDINPKWIGNREEQISRPLISLIVNAGNREALLSHRRYNVKECHDIVADRELFITDRKRKSILLGHLRCIFLIDTVLNERGQNGSGHTEDDR